MKLPHHFSRARTLTHKFIQAGGRRFSTSHGSQLRLSIACAPIIDVLEARVLFGAQTPLTPPTCPCATNTSMSQQNSDGTSQPNGGNNAADTGTAGSQAPSNGPQPAAGGADLDRSGLTLEDQYGGNPSAEMYSQAGVNYADGDVEIGAADVSDSAMGSTFGLIELGLTLTTTVAVAKTVTCSRITEAWGRLTLETVGRMRMNPLFITIGKAISLCRGRRMTCRGSLMMTGHLAASQIRSTRCPHWTVSQQPQPQGSLMGLIT